jgi:uncharacterized protein YbjT (DUF2867 family)
MRGLVTIFGGSGFIGSQTVRALAKAGRRVRVAVRRPWQAYRLRMLGDVGQIEIVQANVRVPETVAAALEGAEAAVYCVGAPFESGAQTFESLRVEGARNAAETALRLGVGRFVHLSGLAADAHSASKTARTAAEGEAAVRAAWPAATIVRPSVVFGQGDVLFNRLASLAVRLPLVMPVLGAEARIQPVFVADVARGIAAALADPATAGQTYELAGPTVYTMRELTEMTLREIGRSRTLIELPAALVAPLALGGDLLATLGLAPPLTSDQAALLSRDHVATAGAPGFAELGIAPQALEPIIPTYLYPYRKGGQYADQLTAEARA